MEQTCLFESKILAGKHALVVLSRVEAVKIVSFAVISTYFK